MMWAVSVQALALLIVAVPPVVHRDPADDLAKAAAAFDHATSWHAEEHMASGKVVTLDYVAPDRYRVTLTPAMVEVIIGSDVYMVNNGHSIKMPMGGASMQQTFQQARFSVQGQIQATAKDLGMQTVNGQSLHAYSFTGKDGVTVTVYLNGDMLPVQSVAPLKQGTMTITYSQYNAPISIDAP